VLGRLIHYKMKRHRSALRSVSPICVMLTLCRKIVACRHDGLNAGCDTDRLRSEELSLPSVSIDTVEPRSVSDWLAHCDTDRRFAPLMTLP
jgi:hypothetical protein